MADLDARAFKRVGGHLVPSDFAADEFLATIKDGSEVLLTIRKARSVPHHRWFFGLLRKVIENTEQWGDEEDLLDDLKIATGHKERRINIVTGEVYERAKSINFASMPEDKFTRFRDRCLYVLAHVLGIDAVQLMEETDATQPPSREKGAR